MIFSIFALPIIEVVFLKNNFFSNFGQTLHLVSIVTASPFILLWRKKIEKNTKILIKGNNLEKDVKKISLSTIAVSILILLNLYGTLSMLSLTNKYSSLVEAVIPSDINKLEGTNKITITFNQKMEANSEKLVKTSINYKGNKAPEITINWINSKKMEIYFSRNFIKNESFYLKIKINQSIKENILIERELILNYK